MHLFMIAPSFTNVPPVRPLSIHHARGVLFCKHCTRNTTLMSRSLFISPPATTTPDGGSLFLYYYIPYISRLRAPLRGWMFDLSGETVRNRSIP